MRPYYYCKPNTLLFMSEKKFRPMPLYYLVEPILEKETVAGIEIPGSQKADSGIVYEAGTGCNLASPGDRIYYRKTDKVQLATGSTTLVAVHQSHVICVENEK